MGAERGCPECGYDARSVRRVEVKNRVYANAKAWERVLERPDVRDRPDPAVWSPLEYACHVRDVHRVFGGRVRMMLAEDDPLFENWDQDAAALAGAYREQDPATVAAELAAAAAESSRGSTAGSRAGSGTVRAGAATARRSPSTASRATTCTTWSTISTTSS